MKKSLLIFLCILFSLVSCSKEENITIVNNTGSEKSFDTPGLVDVDLNNSLSEPALWND